MSTIISLTFDLLTFVAELNSLVRYARMRRIHKPNAKRSTDATLYMEIN